MDDEKKREIVNEIFDIAIDDYEVTNPSKNTIFGLPNHVPQLFLGGDRPSVYEVSCRQAIDNQPPNDFDLFTKEQQVEMVNHLRILHETGRPFTINYMLLDKDKDLSDLIKAPNEKACKVSKFMGELFYGSTPINRATKFVKALYETHGFRLLNVYVNVQPLHMDTQSLPYGRCSEKDIAFYRFLYLDIDADKVPHRDEPERMVPCSYIQEYLETASSRLAICVRELGLGHAGITFSNERGFNSLFKLNEEMEVNEENIKVLSGIISSINSELFADLKVHADSTYDAPRIMGVAGTWNFNILKGPAALRACKNRYTSNGGI